MKNKGLVKTKLIHGDCLEKMKDIADDSVDAIIADPPVLMDFNLTGQQVNGMLAL